MSVHVIPTRNDVEHYDFEVELDGVNFTLELRWNARAEGWFASLYDSEGVPLAQGVRVVTGLPLFLRASRSRRPQGVLLVSDTTGKRTDAGRYQLGASHVLLYLDAAEVAA